MISSVKSVYQMYQDHLQEIQNEKKKNESDLQCQALSSDMEKLKVQCNQLKPAINLTEKDFIECKEQDEVKTNIK